ncbi:MAG TPA: phosphoribosyltransferase [Pseudacidobacterium sp.]|jgi:putative phosphoribosyl transferase|nr:phosphoribosyltransferase [Pseudacidobacterium sp.]
MFRDRADAGDRLAEHLQEYANRDDVVVMGLPRGGIPVAFQIAQKLRAPLDVLLVRKLGAPGQPELAMGAVAPGGVRILDRTLINKLRLSEEELAKTIDVEERELQRRELFYEDIRPFIAIKDKIVIVVDDGIATGASMMAAVAVLRTSQLKKIVVATPVAPPHAKHDLLKTADEFICLHISDYFPAVGFFYQDFAQTSDEEVRSLLSQSTSNM